MDLLAPSLSVLITAIGGAITIYVARKKGLPSINREVEERMGKLIDTLKDQLDASNARFDELEEKFIACKGQLDESQRNEERYIRRLRLAEADLLELYRLQGKRPPRRLVHPENGNGQE